MSEELTLEEVRNMAVEAGLARLAPEHLQELLRATRMARQRRASLPTADIVPADEPAHVYRPDRRDPR